MKAILIDNRLIIREMNKTVLRNMNHLSLELSLEPVAGEILTKDSLEESAVVDYAISKADNPDAWSALKDANNAEVISYVKQALDDWNAVYQIEESRNEEGTGWSDEFQTKIDTQSKYWNLLSILALAEKYKYEIIEI